MGLRRTPRRRGRNAGDTPAFRLYAAGTALAAMGLGMTASAHWTPPAGAESATSPFALTAYTLLGAGLACLLLAGVAAVRGRGGYASDLGAADDELRNLAGGDGSSGS